MPAVHAKLEVQRSDVATQWKDEIREFCRQIQTDIRQALSDAKPNAEVAKTQIDPVTTETQIPDSAKTKSSSIVNPHPEPEQTEASFAPAASETPDPIVESDVHDPTDSTEDRLRKLREQLNHLIDVEDA